ncbi:MAG: hypothetical protein AAB567_02280 [Patescibacteria group bacterium]
MKALRVIVQTKDNQGDLKMAPGCAITELFVEGRPDHIQLRIKSEVRDGITPMVIFGGQPHEYAGEADFTLTIPVRWEEIRGRWIPQTRQRGVDNADCIMMDPALHFRDIQVALVTRQERFFITAQHVFQGWVRMVEGKVRFIPSLPEYAYPGMDYAATWKGMGEFLAVMGRIVEQTVSALGVTLETPKPAQWSPPEIPELNGWQRGVVEFFNPITNTGRLISEDGAEYHIGSNALSEVQGPVKLLAPMKGVYFRPGQPPQENQRYVSVKAIKWPKQNASQGP